MNNKTECWATFHGEGGHPYQNTEANELLSVGAKYKVIGGEIGRSYTSLVLEGQVGYWNSVLFDFDHESAPLEKTYLGVSRNLIAAATKSYPAEMDGNTYDYVAPKKENTCQLTVSVETREILEVLARASNMSLDEYVKKVCDESLRHLIIN